MKWDYSDSEDVFDKKNNPIGEVRSYHTNGKPDNTDKKISWVEWEAKIVFAAPGRFMAGGSRVNKDGFETKEDAVNWLKTVGTPYYAKGKLRWKKTKN